MRVGSQLYGADLAVQRNLLGAYAQLSLASTRLSTMSRINRASDDPAGLIAVEQLEAELVAIKAAGDNAARAAGAVHVADAAMGEVGNLLNSIRSNVIAAAGGGLSEAEIDAKQMEVDAALEAIDRIGSYTSFGGRQLLEGGSMTFNVSPDVADTTTLELPAVDTQSLGSEAGRLADLAGGGTASLASGNSAESIDVLDAAQSQVLQARARLGAFEKYTIDSTQRVLGAMEENIRSVKSRIGDTDVAVEMSRMIRAEIMVQAATSTMALAGERHRMIGGLLGGF
ncbi:MAG TPA: flagellin [Thermoguttaceae bacterium]|nr:flagellin [Thermoguttaceae bacterium]